MTKIFFFYKFICGTNSEQTSQSYESRIYVEKSHDQIESFLNKMSQFYVIFRFYVAFTADQRYRKIAIWLYFYSRVFRNVFDFLRVLKNATQFQFQTTYLKFEPDQ